MKAVTFVAPVKGVGRKDYSKAIEYSTQPYITPSLRQDRDIAIGTVTNPTLPFPTAWMFPLLMPQEDGTWDWLASSITTHFFEVFTSIMTNHLVVVGLIRYASIDDFFLDIIAERSPILYSYNKAEVNFLKGIPTKVGSLYCLLAGAWPYTDGIPDAPDYELTVGYTGIATDLTAPWMV